MERSSSLSKILNSIAPFADFLYLLQLEEYRAIRYWGQLGRFFFRRNIQVRDHLKKTLHIKAVLVVTIALMCAIATASLVLVIIFINSLWIQALAVLSIATLLPLLIPIWIGIVALIHEPVYKLWNKHTENTMAKYVRKNFPDMKIVGITGSYGKTTTKNFVYELTRHTYKAQVIPGNINTAIGIAEWIKKNLNVDTELLIAEMSAYTRGEIRDCCNVIAPDIAVITSLGDQHLEQFGSFKNLVLAKSEIFENAKDGATCLIPEEYKKHISPGLKCEAIEFGPELTYKGKIIKSNLTSPTQRKNLQIALAIAQHLNIDEDFTTDAVKNLDAPSRRQLETEVRGFQTLDDSYNISFKTGTDAIRIAKEKAHHEKKKLVVVCAGIPEVGEKSSEVNEKYGKILAEKANHIVLLRSILSSDISRGVEKGGVEPDSITWALTMREAWDKIVEQYRPADTYVLMQPELTDLHY